MPEHEKDIIDEIHERRMEIMAKFDNDLDRYCEYLRKREQEHPERVVNQITYVRDDRVK